MKINKIALLTGSLVMLVSGSAAATQCVHALANMMAGKTQITCLQAAGNVTFKGTTIEQALTVTGKLDAQDARLNSLSIVGDVTLKNTTVAGAAQIVGALQASDSSFKDKIQVSSGTVTLNHSNTQDIEIKTDKTNTGTNVYLNDNSVVNGNITFVNGNGLVKNNQSKITGKIIGGKLAN